MDDIMMSARRRGEFLPAGLAEPRRPVVAIRFGRGRTGGSTFLDLLIQLARHAGREVVIGDGDRRNPTLSGFYPPGAAGGASQPTTDSAPDVKDWLSGLLGEAASLHASAVVDLGGGDRIMQEYGQDLGLVEFCQSEGLEPLAAFLSGPEADDFEHVLAIWRGGYFRPQRSLLVLNEHLVPQGRTTTGAFDRILGRPEMEELVRDGVKTLLLPRLPCMTHVRESGLGFVDAASNVSGKSGKPLDLVRQFMVRTWIKRVLEQIEAEDALGWLP